MDLYWNQVDNNLAWCMTTPQFYKRLSTEKGWSFSFVRHPVSRLYSCWNNKIVENTALTPGFVNMGTSLGMDFDSFVKHIADSSDATCDIHVRSQTAILTDNGHLVPNFIGRVENIETDWAHVQYEVKTRTGINLGEIMKKNTRGKTTPDIAQTLAPRTLQLIQDRYQSDFDLFYPSGARPSETSPELNGAYQKDFRLALDTQPRP